MRPLLSALSCFASPRPLRPDVRDGLQTARWRSHHGAGRDRVSATFSRVRTGQDCHCCGPVGLTLWTPTTRSALFGAACDTAGICVPSRQRATGGTFHPCLPSKTRQLNGACPASRPDCGGDGHTYEGPRGNDASQLPVGTSRPRPRPSQGRLGSSGCLAGSPRRGQSVSTGTGCTTSSGAPMSSQPSVPSRNQYTSV